MRVPSVRPENEQSVKEWLNVGYHRPALREDLQQATMHLGTGQKMRLAAQPGATTLHCTQVPIRACSTDTSLPPTTQALKRNDGPEHVSPWRWAGI